MTQILGFGIYFLHLVATFCKPFDEIQSVWNHSAQHTHTLTDTVCEMTSCHWAVDQCRSYWRNPNSLITKIRRTDRLFLISPTEGNNDLLKFTKGSLNRGSIGKWWITQIQGTGRLQNCTAYVQLTTTCCLTVSTKCSIKDKTSLWQKTEPILKTYNSNSCQSMESSGERLKNAQNHNLIKKTLKYDDMIK